VFIGVFKFTLLQSVISLTPFNTYQPSIITGGGVGVGVSGL
jgi:hypothetical protein